MFLKVVGMILLFLVCVGAGMFAAQKLVRRASQLEALIGAVGFISTEIRYSATQMNVLLARLDAMAEYGRLKIFGFCGAGLDGRRGLSSVWESALEQSRPYLSLEEADYEALRVFGRSLGATDVEGQLANCENCRALLTQRLGVAREDQRRRGKMYSSLGVLTGVFFLILLI
ncbi:MAG: stage III sporulation protein AB [Clostridia bacterium]|nr:stage III sporulation protein AB [Clostridia bacterium]MDR3645558.1 stage III sporulation protein AB [Clostridia bacterium]